MIVLAHLSDTHFDGGERNVARAQRVMAQLANLRRPVDAILVTGDITDHGLPSEYEEAAKVLVAEEPVLLCPGNHDVREAYREVLLGEEPGGGPINRVHRVGGAVFAMCDSTIPGEVGGVLDDETFAWLEQVVAGSADAPVFICFHHPPAVLHSPFLDEIRQVGEERLAALVRRSPQVVALVSGHAHTAAVTTFAGRPLLVAPGVVSTLRLPWEREELIDFGAPPGYAFHVLDDDRRVTTHYRVVL